MTINSASLPHFNQGDTVLIFTVGDVGIGECGEFSIDVYLDCNTTVLGQLHCTEAHIFPDTLCSPIEPNWDMSSISVERESEIDSVCYFVKNEGIGNMNAPLYYYIVVDEVIMKEGYFQLNSGAIEEVAIDCSNIANKRRTIPWKYHAEGIDYRLPRFSWGQFGTCRMGLASHHYEWEV